MTNNDNPQSDWNPYSPPQLTEKQKLEDRLDDLHFRAIFSPRSNREFRRLMAEHCPKEASQIGPLYKYMPCFTYTLPVISIGIGYGIAKYLM
jgi:hypothetical protein